MTLDTRRWLVTTIAGFVLLTAWLLSSTKEPVFVFSPEVQTVLLAISLGALGLGQYAAYKSVALVEEITKD